MSIKVLMYSKAIDNGGVERMLYEWIKNIEGKEIHFDILTEVIVSDNMVKSLEKLGTKVLLLPRSKVGSKDARIALRQILRKEKYDIVHLHIGVSYAGWIHQIAKDEGITVRISHSHNMVTKDLPIMSYIGHFVYRPILRKDTTDFFACGEEAGKSLFGNNCFSIIHNGIDIDTFQYNSNDAKRIRSELQISKKTFVVGSVGRLSYQKNYNFLLKVFNEICKMDHNAKLLLVGNGEDEEQLKKTAYRLGIYDDVIFYGNSNEIPAMMSTMDVFVLPSHYEGLGLVLIEAQSIGIPCVASDNIPEEVNITGTVKFLSLDMNIKEWANCILLMRNEKRHFDNRNIIIEAGYDIKDISNRLKLWYIRKSMGKTITDEGTLFYGHKRI